MAKKIEIWSCLRFLVGSFPLNCHNHVVYFYCLEKKGRRYTCFSSYLLIYFNTSSTKGNLKKNHGSFWNPEIILSTYRQAAFLGWEVYLLLNFAGGINFTRPFRFEECSKNPPSTHFRSPCIPRRRWPWSECEGSVRSPGWQDRYATRKKRTSPIDTYRYWG